MLWKSNVKLDITSCEITIIIPNGKLQISYVKRKVFKEVTKKNPKNPKKQTHKQ